MRRLAFLCLFAISLHAQSVDDRVENLLARMTLEEKIGQLTQLVPDQPEFPAALKAGLVGSILNGGGAAQINATQRAQITASRLHIPLLVGNDVIHGYRTIFPIPLAIASSWNPQLAELTSHVAATEARAAGIRWTFAPMVDIARDARWGRIAEGAGEDSFLGSAMAAAYVRGFQGQSLAAPDSLIACAKHYAAYGAAEGGRDYNAAEMSERTLREVYLPPFHAAVDAGAGTLMSAFESLNGVPASANRHLLDEILRREWKFRGFVVSDWDAVGELMNHGIAATKQEAAIKAITAGVDMDMWDNAYATLAAAVRDGRLPQPVIDNAVRRILRMKFLAGLFDDPYTDETRTAAATLTSSNRAAARRVAQQSIVLLKNDGNLLPLAKSGKRIVVVGPLADSKDDMLGPWAAEGKAEETTSAFEGIHAAAPSAALASGTDEEIATFARNSDVVIAVLGETRHMSGEAASRASIDVPADQQKLLETLVATGKPVVLVVMSGRPLAISWAAQHVPAIVQAWFLGTEGGNALADVLFGDVNPSGKLPVTIPRTTGQVPIYYAHLNTGRPPAETDHYTSKYIDVPIGPLFPFGFGLSYTRFEYSNLKVSPRSASADVRNAGDRAGEEIVQMYIGDPVASVARPVKELKGFQRVALKPGETKRVEFTIAPHDLEFWSGNGWIAEPGEFKVWIGPDSDRGLEGSFQLKAGAPARSASKPRSR
ncbi:MAG TPA: glycoside hydrolase family 3 N-terminal domain-containing protein [Thermoanaerobaculia bacterium]